MAPLLGPFLLEVNMTVLCVKCNKSKELTQFSSNKVRKSGSEGTCKTCNSEATSTYHKTMPGLIKRIYNNQKMISKRRGHPAPTYTQEELFQWAMDHGFEAIHAAWEVAGHPKALVPSCDRKDNSRGYSLDNLRLVTFQTNLANQKKGNIAGTEVPSHAIAVLQYTKEGKLVARHSSVGCALRAVGREKHGTSNILSVCRKLPKYHTAYGFVWRFVDDPIC